MKNLITELELDHKRLFGHLDAIKESKFARTVIVQELTQAKSLIISHLKKEDDQVYAPMMQAEKARGVAEQFRERMNGITGDVMAFFDKYDLGNASDLGTGFVRDFGTISGQLRTRMQQEESRLYPLFQETVMSTRG